MRTVSVMALRRHVIAARAYAQRSRGRGGAARVRPHVDALVSEGKLELLRVDDGGPPLVGEARQKLDGTRPSAAVERVAQ
jgi:hypothetical protein